MKFNLVIVLEAPSDDDQLSKHLLSGAAGYIATNLLEQFGVNVADCHVTSLLKKFPGYIAQTGEFDFSPYYTNKKFTRPAQAFAKLTADLFDELSSIQANAILAFGEHSLRALTGKTNINNHRGTVLPALKGTCKVIPTYNIQKVCRQWDFYPLFWHDLKRAVHESTHAGIAELPYAIAEVRTLDDAEWLATPDTKQMGHIVGYDIETAGNQISFISFATPHEAWVIPLFHQGISFWPEAQEIELWKLIKRILESDVPKAAHNANFDNLYLSLYGIHPRNLVMDTMLAFSVLHPELPKDIATCSSILGSPFPYWKDKALSPDLKGVIEYSGMDSIVAAWLAEELGRQLEQKGLLKFYQEKVHAMLPVVEAIQRRGMSFDMALRNEFRADYQYRVQQEQADLEKKVGHLVNVGSIPQVRQLLYNELRLPVQYQKKTLGPATDDKSLQILIRKHPDSTTVIQSILDIRSYAKALSKDLNVWPDSDGRIRSSYNIAGTEIGRMSANEMPWGTGTNHQNVTRGEFRRMYRATSGHTFIQADYKQAELYVVGYLSGDENLIANLESGNDVHRNNAATMFKKPVELVTPEERHKGKTASHAFDYTQTARGAARSLGLELREAEALRSAYFSAFPGIGAWHEVYAQQLKRNPVLTTPHFGRVRRFWGRPSDPHVLGMYLAYTAEAIVADLLNLSLRRLHDQLPALDSFLVLQMHDSLLVEVPNDKIEQVISVIKAACHEPIMMIDSVHGNAKVMTIPIELKQGETWFDLLGLRGETCNR